MGNSRRAFLSSALALGLGGVTVVVARAQSGSDGQEEGVVPVFTGGTELVVLHVTVADKDDRIVPDLKEDSFEIYENGVLQPIKLFRREDVPVSVGILVDNSGSMRDKRLKVNAAAVDFVKASNPDDEVFIVNFNDDAYLDSPFTNDIDRMQDALQRIDSRGGTAFYLAIQMSLDYLNEKAKHDKRVLLLITDGEDNASKPKLDLETLVRELQEQNNATTIYSIGLLSEEEKGSAKRAARAIRYITRATGGPSYFPETVDEVHSLTTQIAYDIRNQYTLAYTPTDLDSKGFREIKIELKGKAKKYKVRHRPGYYAQ
ncbi:MAG: VWA domain-containing protein [Acidobacteria bacterium]|nr:VWA domain-containing protein [Acidobacteriota bacterium]